MNVIAVIIHLLYDHFRFEIIANIQRIRIICVIVLILVLVLVAVLGVRQMKLFYVIRVVIV